MLCKIICVDSAVAYLKNLRQTLIQKSPIIHRCLHYDLCDVQIDWFHWRMSTDCEVMLGNIIYVTVNIELTVCLLGCLIVININYPDVILAQ